MFFVTGFEHLPDPDYYTIGDIRCWGYYKDFNQANYIVVHNKTDLNEGIYEYCIIEKFDEGVTPCALERWFYKFNRVNGEYEPIEELKCFEQICNFGIG